MARIYRGPRAARNPYFGALTVGFVIGIETSNVIPVAVQVNSRGSAVSERTPILVYASTDALGDIPAVGIVAPDGGITIGTNGTVVQAVAPQESLLAVGTLLIDANAVKFKTTTTATYTVGRWQTTKAATTALVFSAAHVISASKFGVVLIQVDKAGAVSTKVPLATQAYNSAALAFAALPAADAGKVALGYIAIATGVGAWTANTTDMTNASGVTTAAFIDAPLNGIYPASVTFISEPAGTIDLNVNETRVRTFYLNALVGGRKFTSDPITFA